MKKLISIILVLTMALSIGTVGFTTSAFAADANETEIDVAETKSDIISMLLELAKIASNVNDSARETLSDSLKEALVGKIAGDSAIMKPIAEWIVNQAMKLSGTDNLLTLNKQQAEKIADFLTGIYSGKLADYVDSPYIKILVKLVPEDFYKQAIVWILSDGLGDTLKDFIKQNGGEAPEEPEKPDDSVNAMEIIKTVFVAIGDFFKTVYNDVVTLFKGIQTA